MTSANESKKPKEIAERTPLKIENSLTDMETVDDQFRLAKMYLTSKVLPARFNSAEMIVTALHFAREHFPGTPLTALRQTAVINGTPCFFGDLPLALVQRSGLMEIMNETFEGDVKLESLKATCLVKRKGMVEIKREFSISDAKRAGLWASTTYQKYPSRMLQMRARSWALKDGFADILAGLGILEYDHNATVVSDKVIGELTGPSKSDELTSKYSNELEKEAVAL